MKNSYKNYSYIFTGVLFVLALAAALPAAAQEMPGLPPIPGVAAPPPAAAAPALPDIALPGSAMPPEPVADNTQAAPDTIAIPDFAGPPESKKTAEPVMPPPQENALPFFDKMMGGEAADTANSEKTPDTIIIPSGEPAEASTPDTTAVADAAASNEVKKPARKRKKAKVRGSANERVYSWKTYVLPEVISKKKYDIRNRHLPKITYEQEYDALLFHTAARNNVNGLRSLLAKGVSLNIRNSWGETPLIVAVKSNAINTMRLLLARGANPNAADTSGNTALHYAASMGSYPMTEALLEMGASRNVSDVRGVTPAAYAQYSPNRLIGAALTR